MLVDIFCEYRQISLYKHKLQFCHALWCWQAKNHKSILFLCPPYQRTEADGVSSGIWSTALLRPAPCVYQTFQPSSTFSVWCCRWI